MSAPGMPVASHKAMARSWLVLVCMLTGWLSPAASARADTAIRLDMGFGESARIGGDLARHFETSGEVSGRFALGLRRGHWSLDAVFFGTDLRPAGRPYDPYGPCWSTLSPGIELRRFVPIVRGLHLYVRGGVSYTWILGEGQLPLHGLSGAGFAYGTGVEYRWLVDLPRTRMGLIAWADVGQQRAHLARSGIKPASAELGFGTMGLSVSFGLRR